MAAKHLYRACRDRSCPRPACIAYIDGRDDGHQDGYADGKDDGHKEGYAEGHRAGWSEGYAAGLAAGQR